MMTLFDTGDYWRHPGLWPGGDDTVMTDDQAAELLWPGITSGKDWQDTAGEGPAGWDMERCYERDGVVGAGSHR